MRALDTPTRLRKKYDVNSPKVSKGRSNANAFNNAHDSEEEANYPTHLVTQVARPDTNNNQKHNNQQQPDVQSNLQVAHEKEGCCWYCLPICGLRPKNRNAPRTELTVANKEGSRKNDALARPPSNRDDEDINQSESSTAERDARDPHNAQGGYPNDGPIKEVQLAEPMRQPSPSLTHSHTPIPGLLEPKTKKNKGKKCLVLDLDETLVHSSFKPVNNADFIVPVEIDGVVYKVYVLKRPFVDYFLTECAKHYELVVFTASLSKYANPLLDMLDTSQVIEHRLFRESCVLHGQAYVKDLSKLGRRMEDIIFVDNSPLSYAFQPTSAVPILSWFDDPNDTQLRDLLPVLRTTLRDMTDVRELLDANNKSFEWLCQQHRR